MKNLFLIIALISLACNFTCCKTKKNAIKTTNLTNMKTEQMRLVVSFISKGAGVDAKAHEEFDALIKNHPKKPVFESFRWGREGEHDLCFKLTELTKKEQITLIENLKKITNYNDMFFVKENVDYTRK